MSCAVMLVALLLTVLAVACDASGSSGSPSTSRVPDPPAAVAAVPKPSEISANATTTPHAEKPRESERPPPLRVTPKTLATSWSAYLGRRVQLPCQPVRRLDLTRTLVVAGGEKFVVMGPPDVTPCLASTSTFTVMGSASVAMAGRTILPELLLEDGDGKDGAR